MAFKTHINYELIFFRNGKKAYFEALSGYKKMIKDVNYGLNNEHTESIILPSSYKSITNATQAIINWACCIEACLNILLYKKFGSDISLYKSYTKERINNRLNIINKYYNNIFNKDLKNGILAIYKTRNEIVHFDDVPFFTGGRIYPPELERLSKSIMDMHYKIINDFANCISRNSIGIYLNNPSCPIYGDGDYDFLDE